MIFSKENNVLTARRGGETLRIEGWGKDALRVRAYMDNQQCGCDWALTEQPGPSACEISIGEEDYRVFRTGSLRGDCQRTDPGYG